MWVCGAPWVFYYINSVLHFDCKPRDSSPPWLLLIPTYETVILIACAGKVAVKEGEGGCDQEVVRVDAEKGGGWRHRHEKNSTPRC